MNNRFNSNKSETNRILKLHEQSGFVKKQGRSNLLDKFTKRQEVEEELGGMISDPRITAKEYGGGGSKSGYEFGEVETELPREVIIKDLWSIQNLLSDKSGAAPAIALTQVIALLDKLGENVNLGHRDYGATDMPGFEGTMEQLRDLSDFSESE